MSYRYTNTDKWNDAWFSGLKPMEKLLFNYLCDNCDIAGFVEVTIKNWCIQIGADKNVIEGALKGLQRGLLFSQNKDCIYIRNYLKHQKNLPLDTERNPAHKGIYKRFELYSYKFDIKDVNEFIKGASEGLQSPIGNGNGNGKDNGSVKTIQERKEDFQNTCTTFLEKYDKKLIREFFDYWTEINTNGKKMRFEMEKVFEFSKRLATWYSRSIEKQFPVNKPYSSIPVGSFTEDDKI